KKLDDSLRGEPDSPKSIHERKGFKVQRRRADENESRSIREIGTQPATYRTAWRRRSEDGHFHG
ncbi:hypothetical protein V3C99_016976, partial [Haemonchus contortus]